MNRIRWHQPLPHWAQLLGIVFGLICIGSAIWQMSDLTLPGIFVGAAWALFGWKGHPLFDSVKPNAPTPDGDFAEGIRTIRRRRLLGFAVPFLWLFLAAFLLPPLGPRLLPTAFFLSAMPLVAFYFWCVFIACPRCRQHFFIDDRFFRTSLTRCVHCGLSLKSDRNT